MYCGYYGLGYSLFDPTMILVYIGALLSMWASSKVNSTFQRYSRVRSMTGMTGAEAAKRLLSPRESTMLRFSRCADSLPTIMTRGRKL